MTVNNPANDPNWDVNNYDKTYWRDTAPVDNRDDQVDDDTADVNVDDTVDELDDPGCTWCIGGFAPAGTHTILGLVYVACINCADTCRCCDGIGLFPADTTCPHCMADALAAVGYTARFCHTCAGILTVDRTEGTLP